MCDREPDAPARPDESMSPLRQPRDGKQLVVKGRHPDVSFFPVTYRSRGWTLASTLFAVSPWAVIRRAITDDVEDEDRRREALAFLGQAEDFYVTARERLAANPLLFYYAFLNLGKALLLARGIDKEIDQAHHGLEQPKASGSVLEEAYVKVRQGRGLVHVFPDLIGLTDRFELRSETELPIGDLLAQVVVGHRQWVDATDERERFVALVETELMRGHDEKIVWARLYVSEEDLGRHDITLERLVDQGHLMGRLRVVDSPRPGWRCLESVAPVAYTTDPADQLHVLAAHLRPSLWRIVSSLPSAAYRRYYLHLTPAGEKRVPQLASLWALFFYFGSIVRYRPHVFDEITAGKYGAFVTEFVAAQPEQLLYLLASEACQREVAKPAIA